MCGTNLKILEKYFHIVTICQSAFINLHCKQIRQQLPTSQFLIIFEFTKWKKI